VSAGVSLCHSSEGSGLSHRMKGSRSRIWTVSVASWCEWSLGSWDDTESDTPALYFVSWSQPCS
jgi:hypothetical protein